jgi:hypothetical protein
MGLDTMTYLQTDRQSQCDFDFDLRESFEKAVRRVSCESPGSKDVNTESEKSAALGTVIRRQPVKTQKTEKINTCCSELQCVN